MSDEAGVHIIKPKALVSDPRVFFAAERTHLAWVRSGLAVMALGLVIDKFGLLLAVLNASTVNHHQTHQTHQDISHYLGIILILVGTLIVLGAQYNHHVYLLSLPPEDLPKQAIVRLDWFLTISIAIIGVLLLNNKSLRSKTIKIICKLRGAFEVMRDNL